MQTADDETNELLFEMLRHPQDVEDVIKVCGKSKDLSNKSFYISSKDLQASKLATNALKFSKALLVAAFTDKALLECSVSGGQFRAAGRANITQKPPLDADVVAVMVDIVFNRQMAKKWIPEVSRRDIMNGLRQKLVDVRPRLKRLLNDNEQEA